MAKATRKLLALELVLKTTQFFVKKLPGFVVKFHRIHPRRRCFHNSFSTRLHPGSKTYPQHGRYPIPERDPGMLAGDDKPEAGE